MTRSLKIVPPTNKCDDCKAPMDLEKLKRCSISFFNYDGVDNYASGMYLCASCRRKWRTAISNLARTVKART
jgi:hypothetical protein